MKSHKIILIATSILLASVVGWYIYADRQDSTPMIAGASSLPSEMKNSASTGDVVFPVSVAIARRGNCAKKISTNGVVRAKKKWNFLHALRGK